MVSSKRNKRMQAGSRPILLICCFFLAFVTALCAEDADQVKKNQKEVQNTVNQVLNNGDFVNLKNLRNYDKKSLAVISKKKALDIYDKHKDRLLTDHYSSKSNEEQNVNNIAALQGLVKLAGAIDAENVFKNLENDISRITLEKKDNLQGWKKIEYLHTSSASVVFDALLKRYGANKLMELNNRLIKMNRPRLRIRLLYTIPSDGRGYLKGNELSFVTVLSNILANGEFNFPKDDVKLIVKSSDFPDILKMRICSLYEQLNNEEKEKATTIFQEFNLEEELDNCT